jgi:hypothetical protein
VDCKRADDEDIDRISDDTVCATRGRPGGRLDDVRAAIKTDDGALIYLTYNGVFKDSQETEQRANKGEVLTSQDIYFVIAPTMQTSAKKYEWLNGVQCIGKMASYKSDAYVKYIYVVR